jgi:hypothetical protein
MGMSTIRRASFGVTRRTFVGLLAPISLSLWRPAAALACACEQISPMEGFDRAQYVFTGTVVEAGTHSWVVEVDRVWKGRETLTPMARLVDVYAKMACEFFFKEGERYLVFAVRAKGGRDIFYLPQACNWTTPLGSKRVTTLEGESLWLEELIVREYGPGEGPGDMRGSGRLP